jgi:hypothetical protein
MDVVAITANNRSRQYVANVCEVFPECWIRLTQTQNKKGFRYLKPFRVNLLKIDYFTTAAAESATTVTTESTAVAAESTSVATASTAAAASSFFPPHATIATAKPHTIRDAINFFIVNRLFEFGREDTRRVQFSDQFP